MTTIAERNPRVNAIWWTFLACLLVILTVSHGDLWGKHAPIAGYAIVGPALILGCFRGWCMGLRINQSGVTVRNYFRTRRISWPEVAFFADGSAMGLFSSGLGKSDLGFGWALSVALVDKRPETAGRHTGSPEHQGGRRAVNVSGTLAGFSPRPETLAAIRQAAELDGKPAELTGVRGRRELPGSPGQMLALCVVVTLPARP